jgi:hypothetical protein
MSAWWSPLQETASQWSEHKDARLGAALAYYSIFSLGPLIVIAIAIAVSYLAARPCKVRFPVRWEACSVTAARKPSTRCLREPIGRGRASLPRSSE